MKALETLARLIRIEAVKFWRKPVAWMVLVIMLSGPIAGEIFLARISPRDAIFPSITQFLFSADLFLFIALATVVLSVMALGNDYELGTVRAILSRGVDRYQFILSKIITTVGSALVNSFVFLTSAMASAYVAQTTFSDVPFFEAAGRGILWRGLGAIGVVGLVNFVLSGIVILALVLGKSSWMGMLAGLGVFFADFFIAGVGSGSVLGVDNAYQVTIGYYAISLWEPLFPTDPNLALPRAWAGQGFAGPGQAIATLLLYGAVLTLAAVLIFSRQDLMAKS